MLLSLWSPQPGSEMKIIPVSVEFKHSGLCDSHFGGASRRMSSLFMTGQAAVQVCSSDVPGLGIEQTCLRMRVRESSSSEAKVVVGVFQRLLKTDSAGAVQAEVATA